jgi:signal transduction histidine kinase/ligand-binding sensor domain-containing protein
MRQRLFLFALSFILLKPVFAQQQMGPYMAYGPESKYFSNLNFTVYQSKAGFLWIGTANGIVRFDGKRYKNFFSDYTNPNSPSDNTIPDILEDKNGDLWFCGFYHGLTKYNESTGIFKKYSNPTADNYSYYGIYSGLKDREGNLWFATAGRGLAYYLYEKDSFALYFPEPDKCKDGSIRGENYVTGICEDKFDTGILWISSFNELYSFNKKNKQFIHYPSGVKYFPFVDNTLNNCEADNEGNLWLPSWGAGLLCFNTLIKKYDAQKRKAFPKIVNHVKLINDSILYAACFDDGFYQLNLNTNAFTNITPPRNPADLTVKSTSIQKVSITKDAGIFIGGNYYVYQLHPSFSRLKKNIFYEEKAREGEIFFENILWDESRHQYWITTFNGNGLYTLKEYETIAKKITVAETPAPVYKRFNSLIKDARQRIWVNSYSTGIYLWNETKKNFEKPATGITPLPDSLLNSIFRLQTDSAGNIWMLSRDKFIYFDVLNNKYETFPITWGSNYKGSTSLLPADIKMDADENPWLITLNGLFVCNRKEKKVRHIYDTAFGGIKFSYNSFWGGAFDKQDNLWLASPNGIHVYNTKKNEMVNNFTMADGLPTLATVSIAIDKENRIWANTVAGLAIYNQQEKIWRSFNRFDGMGRDYLDGTLAITANGKIVIEQVNGFLLKDAAEILSAAEVPVLQITSITINDKEAISSPQALKDKKLELPFNQNNISIEFAAMDWLYPNKTNYLVKIDGLQSANTWTPNPEAHINLTGLAPGNYVVHIKAINSSGVWSNEINLSITIKPPFWQTWWFIALSLLAIAAILYLLYRYRVQQLLKMQQMRNNISRDLHDEIGSSVSSVNMLSMVAKKQLGEGHPVTPLLTQIGLSAQNAGDSIDEIIWSVNPGNDSARDTINRLRKYLSEVFELHGIEYNIQLPEIDAHKKLSMQVRRDLWLICKEAVNNMIKYANCSKAGIEMKTANGTLHIKIYDNGVGFDVKAGVAKKRNGLGNMKERVQKYKACTFEINSTPDSGTTILFQLPMNE